MALRLKVLTRLNLIERTDPNASARNNDFTLTESGAALRPILESLSDWSYTYFKEFRGGITSIRLRMWIEELPKGGSVFLGSGFDPAASTG